MGSLYGENIRLTLFGQSHSPAIGMVMEGIPAGERIDMEALCAFLARRAPGKSELATARREEDIPEFLSGLSGDITCGAPLSAILYNADARPGDYDAFRDVPRPGHADYTAFVKYFGHHDAAGGGHFSGRLTAPLCIAGGICKQLLEKEGILVVARIFSVADVNDMGEIAPSVAQKAFPVMDDAQGEKMRARILEAKSEGDSVGGIVECAVLHLPAGLGDPMFGGMENRIAQIVFGIPAVKGIEFGAGFATARMRGSENNDGFICSEGSVRTETNRCGGILGGITNGMPLVFRAAFKPTPSIAKPQKSISLSTGEARELTIRGRHDPCIVPRAVPCVEAAAAIAVYDALLGRRKEFRT